MALKSIHTGHVPEEAVASGEEIATLAVDGVVVARTEHERTVVPDGADVEVLTAVQGG